MGEEYYGVAGTRTNRCVIEDVHVLVPKPVSRWNMDDEKIVDFEIAKDSLILLLGFIYNNIDNGRVLYSGLGKIYQPIDVNLPEGVKAVKIAAGYESIAVLAGNKFLNQIMMKSIQLANIFQTLLTERI